MQAFSAYDLYHGLAVNTHWDFANTPYTADRAKAIACAKELGFPLHRDCCYEPSSVKLWADVAAACGNRFIAYQMQGQVEWMLQSYRNTTALHKAGLLAYLEGGNEEDSDYATGKYIVDGKQYFTPNSIARTQALQREMYAGWKGKLPVINMSLGAGWEDAEGHYDDLGDMSDACDLLNAHTYPQNKQTPSFGLDHIGGLAKLTGTKPVAHTEFGYHTTPAKLDTTQSGVSEEAQAIYLAQAVCSFLPMGYPLLGIFELFDQKTGDADKEKNWGLYRSDYSAKPSAIALKNIADVFREAKKVDCKPLEVTLEGLKPSHKYFLYQMDEGEYGLVMWREEPIYDSVNKVRLGTGYNDVVTINSPSGKATVSVNNLPAFFPIKAAAYTAADMAAEYERGRADVWKAIDSLRA
ncbi:hypothetical protein TA3x_000491 [Tundrisphaera sp. TA3]|uniref:hypothetical protein n=1 Tax=Tundrisphaera sp. TA3 TaxID=3435775 RepID=UPI003EBD32E2